MNHDNDPCPDCGAAGMKNAEHECWTPNPDLADQLHAFSADHNFASVADYEDTTGKPITREMARQLGLEIGDATDEQLAEAYRQRRGAA